MSIDWQKTHAAVWRSRKAYLRPITHIDPISFDQLVGIDEQMTALVRNTERFLAGGRHLWNGGIFLWTCARILDELQRHLPELTPLLKEYEAALGTPGAKGVLERIYPQFPDISIDYSVMEKAGNVVTVKADVGWDDLGNWAVLERLQQADSRGNIAIGPFIGEDTQGCIVSADEGLVATLGLRDMVVVKEKDVVLVMPKEKAAELKQLVARLKQDPRWQKYL